MESINLEGKSPPARVRFIKRSHIKVWYPQAL